VLRSFNDSRIRYYFDYNHGVSYARNRALEISTGNYIAFLDSDDVWMPGKLSTQIDVLNQHTDIDFLFGNFINTNLASGVTNTSFNQNQASLQLLQTTHITEQLVRVEGGFLESIALGNFVATDTVIVRREIFYEIGAFCENLRNSEDFELWWRMGLAGIRFAYLDKILMTRIKPANSLSSPSLLGTQNSLNAIDLCLKNSLEKDRHELVPYLNIKYRNAWQNMIQIYGDLGNINLASRAFIHSLRYGFRPGSLKILLKVMLRSK
jgi:glycosyltransferase involved in cell wall biosynthesis